MPTPDYVPVLLWLVCVVACLAASSALLAGLWWRSRLRVAVSWLFASSALAYCIHSADFMDWTPAAREAWGGLLRYPLAAALALAFAAHLAVARSLYSPASPAYRSLTFWGSLFAWQLALTAWTGYRYAQVSQGHQFVVPPTSRFDLTECTDQVMVTDRGRRMPLYHAKCPSDPRGCDEPFAQQLAGSLVRQSSPDPQSNCHGWVFGNGEYLIRSEQVDIILSENGYCEVEEPRMGDVIIYRNEDGTIIHTGLVRGLLDDAVPLIESKWGIGGRFLHRPLDQVYSRNIQYYRTTRKANLAGLRAQHTVHMEASRPHQGGSDHAGT